MESGGTAPHILNIDIKWEVCGQLHALAALPPGRELSEANTQNFRLVLELIWSK
jgi:hypothetical protein